MDSAETDALARTTDLEDADGSETTAKAPPKADDRSAKTLAFDPQALRAKYRAERDKRLRRDGNDQYVEMSEQYARYLEDPYVDAPIERAPLEEAVDVVVIGGGFGGLLAGARLRQSGVKDIRMIEKGGDFGGTWYWNRYPGAACDIESYVYLPLLEDLNFIPVEKYSRAPEIRDYSRRIAEKFNLYDQALLQTEVTQMRWDEAERRWIIHTNQGDAIHARFVCMANGPLHRPKLPGIAGISDFQGHTFHTSRWDYQYTGGDSNGGLTKIGDKRIGVIGTGATAVQCVPHLGAAAQSLYVFQRTPSSIDVRNNRPTDPDWVQSLKPGWHQARMDNFNTLVSGGHAEEDLVSDGWTDIIRSLGIAARLRASTHSDAPAADPAEMLQIADFQKMEQIRARVDQVVKSPAAEALKPYYNQFCKRPCFHDEYLETFNRPNVHLVDTQGRGVDRITPSGVVVAGVEYPLDCLIYATGFEVGTSYARRAGYEVYGRGGRALSDKWADGVATLHGMHSRDFPNCLIFSNAQSGFTANYPHMLNEQAIHAAHIIAHCLEKGVTTLEPSQAAEDAWISTVIDAAIDRQKFAEECTPGYYNNEGQPSPLAARNGPYGKGSIAFIEILKSWRDKGSFEGLEFDRA